MINIQDTAFSYGPRPVFDRLSLTLGQGSIYGLLGRNGAGKTTLLKLIAGLLMPSNGKITVNGENPAQRTPSILSQIFVIPDEFDLPRLTIAQYADIYGVFYPRFSHPDLLSNLAQLTVDPRQKLHQMSFGQKKKAYIAFALACNTELLLMDEPTNGLDIPSKSEFRRLLSSLVGDNSRTIIISTHQVRDLDQLIDSVIILDGSSILLNASCATITEKLLFSHIENPEKAIYAEKTIHGLWGVCENVDRVESPLDMEILFNTVVTNPQTIAKIFNSHAK